MAPVPNGDGPIPRAPITSAWRLKAGGGRGRDTQVRSGRVSQPATGGGDVGIGTVTGVGAGTGVEVGGDGAAGATTGDGAGDTAVGDT